LRVAFVNSCVPVGPMKANLPRFHGDVIGNGTAIIDGR